MHANVVNVNARQVQPKPSLVEPDALDGQFQNSGNIFSVYESAQCSVLMVYPETNREPSDK